MALATQKRGMSLHIGLNAVDPAHYNGWEGHLNACEYDADDMEGIAKVTVCGCERVHADTYAAPS